MSDVQRATIEAIPTAWPPRAVARVAATAGVLAVAVVATLTVALGNGPWFEAVNGALGLTDPLGRALVFSSWLLVVGVPIVARGPADYGFRVGDALKEWRSVTVVVVAAALLTAALLMVVGPTPYSGASPFVEVVVVPLTEELAFRAAMVTLLLAALLRFHPPGRAALLAVVFDGIAFGLGHAANATALPPPFVVGQVAFATVLGMAAAWLMVRTRSVYPAVLLHAVVNGVVVLL